MRKIIECPYCNYEHDASQMDIECDSFDYECDNCEKEFEISIEYEPIFSTSAIEHKKCSKCSEVVRDFSIKGSRYPFPKEYNDVEGEVVLCELCWYAGMSNDMEV